MWEKQRESNARSGLMALLPLTQVQFISSCWSVMEHTAQAIKTYSNNVEDSTLPGQDVGRLFGTIC
jgi:hypothetical protein